jgi:adenylyl- and sulfurtransferase ThiI
MATSAMVMRPEVDGWMLHKGGLPDAIGHSLLMLVGGISSSVSMFCAEMELAAFACSW